MKRNREAPPWAELGTQTFEGGVSRGTWSEVWGAERRGLGKLWERPGREGVCLLPGAWERLQG